jgi:hypothetical protein
LYDVSMFSSSDRLRLGLCLLVNGEKE